MNVAANDRSYGGLAWLGLLMKGERGERSNCWKARARRWERGGGWGRVVITIGNGEDGDLQYDTLLSEVCMPYQYGPAMR